MFDSIRLDLLGAQLLVICSERVIHGVDLDCGLKRKRHVEEDPIGFLIGAELRFVIVLSVAVMISWRWETQQLSEGFGAVDLDDGAGQMLQIEYSV
jgi:hypothetical protein